MNSSASTKKVFFITRNSELYKSLERVLRYIGHFHVVQWEGSNGEQLSGNEIILLDATEMDNVYDYLCAELRTEYRNPVVIITDSREILEDPRSILFSDEEVKGSHHVLVVPFELKELLKILNSLRPLNNDEWRNTFWKFCKWDELARMHLEYMLHNKKDREKISLHADRLKKTLENAGLSNSDLSDLIEIISPEVLLDELAYKLINKIDSKNVILVIDDELSQPNDGTRKKLVKLFLDTKYILKFVPNIDEALDFMKNLHVNIKLILLDIIFDGKKLGKQYLQQLKKPLEDKKLPVIMLTQLAPTEGEFKTMKALGAVDYLEKRYLDSDPDYFKNTVIGVIEWPNNEAFALEVDPKRKSISIINRSQPKEFFTYNFKVPGDQWHSTKVMPIAGSDEIILRVLYEMAKRKTTELGLRDIYTWDIQTTKSRLELFSQTTIFEIPDEVLRINQLIEALHNLEIGDQGIALLVQTVKLYRQYYGEVAASIKEQLTTVQHGGQHDIKSSDTGRQKKLQKFLDKLRKFEQALNHYYEGNEKDLLLNEVTKLRQEAEAFFSAEQSTDEVSGASSMTTSVSLLEQNLQTCQKLVALYTKYLEILTNKLGAEFNYDLSNFNKKMREMTKGRINGLLLSRGQGTREDRFMLRIGEIRLSEVSGEFPIFSDSSLTKRLDKLERVVEQLKLEVGSIRYQMEMKFKRIENMFKLLVNSPRTKN